MIIVIICPLTLGTRNKRGSFPIIQLILNQLKIHEMNDMRPQYFVILKWFCIDDTKQTAKVGLREDLDFSS